MGKRYLIGTDIGTSGTKTVMADSQGRVVAEAYQEHDVMVPRPLWAEQWPDVWLRAAKNTIKEAVRKSGIHQPDVAGICISGLYGGSGVPLDGAFRPVRPCIIWMDRRAEEECGWVEQAIGREKIFQVTGNGIDTYFGFLKMLWIKNHEPENWDRTKLFLAPNQYVIHQLTGEVCMDHTSAGNLGGIYDLKKHGWSRELMDELRIDRDKLPERLVEPYEIAGYVTREAALELGVPEQTPVCAGCIDCLASTLAAGVLEENQHTAIIGTSINWGVIHSGFPSNSGYITMPYVKDSLTMNYTYGGASTAGALPKWFRDQFTGFGGTHATYRMLDEAAGRVTAGSDGLIVLPYFMGERSPIWDMNAKGTMIGLTLKHTQAHVYRALLESVAYSLRHIMEHSDIGPEGKGGCTVIGGATRSRLWKQIMADVTGIPIRCSRMNIEAPLGDALLAGIGTGLIGSFAEIKGWADFDDEVLPDMGRHAHYQRYYELYKETYLVLKETMRKMSELN